MNGTGGETGLILAGGGARAAYQVGVLKAIRELLPGAAANPFSVVCGTSAGAINAATLAVYADDFGAAVKNLVDVWRDMRAHMIYRDDPIKLARIGLRWLAGLAVTMRAAPVSLLDNAPLASLLRGSLDFARIQRNIDSGALRAVAVTCSGYSSGQSVTFYQGGSGTEQWERTQRVGCAMPLRVEHLMASSALPFLFPAIQINREYFGDGSMRQIAPISPALHLGAARVLVIGTGRQQVPTPRVRGTRYPTLAQIAGHALNSIFLDTLNVDIERLQRINRTINLIPPECRPQDPGALRHVEVLVISPSEPIERLAPPHLHELRWTVRFLLRNIGAMSRHGSNLASYLLFERGFCRALIDLGYRDALARGPELLEFFGRAGYTSRDIPGAR